MAPRHGAVLQRASVSRRLEGEMTTRSRSGNTGEWMAIPGPEREEGSGVNREPAAAAGNSRASVERDVASWLERMSNAHTTGQVVCENTVDECADAGENSAGRGEDGEGQLAEREAHSTTSALTLEVDEPPMAFVSI